MVVINPYLKKPSFLNPAEVVQKLEILSGQTVIDYGSGIGFWAIPIAKKVGGKGRVIAIGKLPERQEVLRSKALRAHLSNIVFMLRDDAENLVPTKQKADWIFVSNILSRINHDETLLVKLADNSEIGTRLVIVDWEKDSFLGPEEKNRLVEDQVVLIAAKAGFRFKHLLDVGTFHFGLLFEYTGEKFHAKKK